VLKTVAIAGGLPVVKLVVLGKARHEQKNGSLGCIYKDVIFSTTYAK
jgi:hypothetical protein